MTKRAVINHAASHDLCQHIRIERFETKRAIKEPATWEWVQAFMAAANKPNLAALAAFEAVYSRKPVAIE